MNKKLIFAALIAAAAAVAGLRHTESPSPASQRSGPATRSENISELTRQTRVANYLQQHQQLPPYYLNKREARRLGWQPEQGNLCEVLPGKAIGGDRFSNREGRLPESQGRKWFEADVNYRCGRRGSDRLVYSSDGLIYLTRDHYRHFQKVE